MKHFISLIILLVMLLPATQAQKVKTIRLKKDAFTLSKYHVVSVIDDRTDTTNIGIVYNLLNKKMIANLEDGVATSISNFINSSAKQDTSGVAVSIHIIQFTVSESSDHLKEKVELNMDLAFYVNGKKMMTYRSTPYATAPDPIPFIGNMITTSLKNIFEQFGDWAVNNQITNSSLSNVEMQVTMATETDDTDQIAYNPLRLLQQTDFTAEPDDLSLAAGMTYSGMSVKYTSQLNNGKTIVKAIVSALFFKNQSWLKKGAKNDYAIAHEQLHFDITAIKACELLAAIKADTFSTDNYSKELDRLYKQYQKEWEQMEKDYDKETVHGTVKEQQLKWERQIKKRLAILECYK